MDVRHWNTCTPVRDAVAPVVAQDVVVRSAPGDRGPRPTAHFTPQGGVVAALAGSIGEGDEELWWGWKKEEQRFILSLRACLFKKIKRWLLD